MHTRPLFLTILSALLLAFMASKSNAQLPPSQYGIKEDTPRTGSMLRRLSVGPVNIPINRSYYELTPSERARFNGHYEHIAEGDEPPFPAHGLYELLDPVRKAQQKLLVEGDLSLVATVDASGSVTHVKALGSPSPEMTQFAARVLMLTKFKPAVCGGSPCQMDFPLYLRFNLD
jgi:hypothetical protein